MLNNLYSQYHPGLSVAGLSRCVDPYVIIPLAWVCRASAVRSTWMPRELQGHLWLQIYFE